MKKRALTAAGLLVAASIAGLVGATDAAANYPCGSTPPADKDSSAYPTMTKLGQEYNGSGTTCGVIGPVPAGHKVDYYCWTQNPGTNKSWTYLRDDNTNSKGWVQDSQLPGGGSTVWCGQ